MSRSPPSSSTASPPATSNIASWEVSGGARIWKVSYHGGSLYALVKAETEERAVEIAKAHRLRKFERSPRLGKLGKSVLDDVYTVALATERDIAWTTKFGGKPFTGMPLPAGERTASSRKRLPGTTEGVEPATHAGGGTFGEAA